MNREEVGLLGAQAGAQALIIAEWTREVRWDTLAREIEVEARGVILICV
jgi:hypothetical protein